MAYGSTMLPMFMSLNPYSLVAHPGLLLLSKPSCGINEAYSSPRGDPSRWLNATRGFSTLSWGETRRKGQVQSSYVRSRAYPNIYDKQKCAWLSDLCAVCIRIVKEHHFGVVAIEYDKSSSVHYNANSFIDDKTL